MSEPERAPSEPEPANSKREPGWTIWAIWAICHMPFCLYLGIQASCYPIPSIMATRDGGCLITNQADVDRQVNVTILIINSFGIGTALDVGTILASVRNRYRKVSTALLNIYMGLFCFIMAILWLTALIMGITPGDVLSCIVLDPNVVSPDSGTNIAFTILLLIMDTSRATIGLLSFKKHKRRLKHQAQRNRDLEQARDDGSIPIDHILRVQDV